MSDYRNLLYVTSLALAILLGFRPDLRGEEPTSDPKVAATAESWRANAAEYARIMSQLKWSPVAETMPHRRGGYFEKGKEYTGVPYSSVRSAGRYIGFEVSLRTFRAAVENPQS